MIDFMDVGENISDEILAAYIDGNATPEESRIIENAINSDGMLSEIVDVANDIKYNEIDNWNIDDGNSSIYSEPSFMYQTNDYLTALSIQEPIETNIDFSSIDFSGDIGMCEDSINDLLEY